MNLEINNTEYGFTLLEALIALIILAVSIVALAGAFSTSIFAISDVENIRLALNIAQANLEMIKNQDFSDIDTDTELNSFLSNLGFSDFTVTGDVTEGDNPMQVDITVSWGSKGGESSITLSTLITSY